jgi:hypothetical protein
VKLRLHGTRAEVAEATRRLVEALEVVSVSPPYPDRGTSVLVRVFLKVRLPEAPQSSTPAPKGSRDPSREAWQSRRPHRREVGRR